MAIEAEKKTRDILSIVNELARLEEKENKTSVLVKRNNTSINQAGRYLDTLARLLADVKDICGAVFFDSNSSFKNPRLLFATNKKNPRSAKDFIKRLREFIMVNDNIGKGYVEKFAYEELMFLAFEKVRTKINWLFSPLNNLPLLNNDEKDLMRELKLFFKDFKEEFESLREDEKQRSLWIREKLKLVNGYVNLISSQEKRESFKESLLWEVLLPILDTNIIIEAVLAGNSPIQEVFDVISEGEVKLVIDSVEESFVIVDDATKKRGDLICHAEMRILKEIHQVKNSSYMHIGVGMLCCVPCHLTLKIVNSERAIDNEVNKYEKDWSELSFFTVCGTHGCSFRGWQDPAISEVCSQSLLRELQVVQNNRLLSEKKRLSTSDFPPQNLTENSQEKYQNYIEQNTCLVS